jgi:2-polyprenyl-6-methoxyphenol hydroxylase-like FAD-dependent oxidoreductase
MRAAVAGFGVAGGALAVLLARAGHAVTLFERAPQPGPVGAGLLLQPSGQSVLRAMGLLEEIESQSARLSGIEALTPRGKVFSDLKVARSLPGAYALGVHRGVLFEALHTAARNAGVTICPGVEIAGARESSGGIVPLDVDGRGRGEFDLLAGCDGARSRLRQVVNPSMKPPRPSVWGALWGTGVCTGVTDHLRQVADGTRRLAGIVPVGGGRATLFWGLHESDLAPLRARGFAAFLAEATAMFPAAGEVLRDVASFDRMTWATWHQLVPDRMVRGRLVLLGDAAHAMNPQLGQGANLALLDAAALVRHLDDLALWERERCRAGRFYGRLSGWLSPFFQSRVPLLGTLRNFGLPLLTAIPWFRRQMELTLAGAKAGFSDQWRA